MKKDLLIGSNTYGLRELLDRDFSGTLAELRSAGIDAIEYCISFDAPAGNAQGSHGIVHFKQAAEMIDRVRKAGLEVYGAHIMNVDFSAASIQLLLDLASDCRLDYLVFSPMLSEIEAAAPLVAPLRHAAQRLREAGVSLLLHNHDHELCDDNGDTVLDYLLRNIPEIGLQLDVGWATYAGADPVACLQKYGERIPIIHFKDITADAKQWDRTDCFTAIGEGAIPLEAILRAAQSLHLHPQGFVIDQDCSATDMICDAAVAVQNLRAGRCVTLPEKAAHCPFSLSVWSYHCQGGQGTSSFHALMQACSRSGVRHVDLMQWEVEFYGLETVKHILTATGMQVGCFITSLDMSVVQPEKLTQVFERALSTALAFGAKKIMVVPDGISCSADQTERRLAADKIIRCYRLAVALAKPHGIWICVEDTPNYQVPLSSTEECAYVLEGVPELGLAYDSANMIPGGSAPLSFYDALKHRICHVHLKDVIYVERGKGEPCADGRDILCVPSGNGCIPLKDLINRLIADDYTGSAMLEYACPISHDYRSHKANIDGYLRALFGE